MKPLICQEDKMITKLFWPTAVFAECAIFCVIFPGQEGGLVATRNAE